MHRDNPFEYVGLVRGDRLIDRRGELLALSRAATNHVAVRLAAPRRFGKTTLLEAHLTAMRGAGHRGVRVDLARVDSVGDAAARVAAAYATLPGSARRRLGGWLDRLGVRVGVGPLDVRLDPLARALPVDAARVALLEVLDLPAALHADDGGMTVVCLDEFQDLLIAGDGLDGLVRSVVQRHGDVATYAFAGSRPSMMRELFADQARPFYGQARPIDVPVLPRDEAAADLEQAMLTAGVDPQDGAWRIVAFTGGHPQRTVLVAHHLFEQLAAGISPEHAPKAALDVALHETSDAHEATWEALGRADRLVLFALARGDAPTGSRVATEHRVARTTLQSALKRLERDGQHVARTDGPPALLDPLLGEWLRRRPV